MTRLVLALALLLAGCYAELDWRDFVWPEGHFKVLFPGKPAQGSREVLLGGVKTRMEMFSVQVEGLAFGVGYAPVPPGESGAVLALAREALVRNIDGKVIAERAVDVPGATMPGREFTAEGVSSGTPMVLAARLVASDGRFYQAVFVGRKDRADKVDTSLFLGSLTLLP